MEYIIGRKGDVLPATQLELGRDVATFAEAIRAALRRAPSIIGVGEMRDTETILAAVLSALLGHLCLSTLHTDSVGETIPRLLAGIPIEIREATARDVMGTMQYIIVQRLLRTTDGKRQAVREYRLRPASAKRNGSGALYRMGPPAEPESTGEERPNRR